MRSIAFTFVYAAAVITAAVVGTLAMERVTGHREHSSAGAFLMAGYGR